MMARLFRTFDARQCHGLHEPLSMVVTCSHVHMVLCIITCSAMDQPPLHIFDSHTYCIAGICIDICPRLGCFGGQAFPSKQQTGNVALAPREM